VVRFVIAGALLGPCLGVALGPLVAGNRLPLYEASIPWRGVALAPGDWPRAPGPGERAETRPSGARTLLIARAPTAAGAEALALELALPRLSRSPELLEARAGRREAWCDALLAGPFTTLTPAGDCAARLHGWAEAWRAVAAPHAGGARAGARTREGPTTTESDLARPALAADAPTLEAALERDARVARAQLFTRIGSLPAGPREVATEAWRVARVAWAARLDTIADAIVARKPRIERELVARVAPVHALEAEPRIPDPGAIELIAASGSEPAPARPVAATWLWFAAAGSALALLAVAPLARRAARARRARHEDRMRRFQAAANTFVAIPPAATATVEARLQIVSGPRPRAVARAAREMAARHLAAGERVLVMDAGRNLRLHDFFAAEPHLGFQECMREGFPLLGVLQSGGFPGLHLLAHGAPARLGSWIPLGGLLDQARPYFSRVILALDPNLPRQVGEALGGRLMDGWWAGGDARARDARRFSTRVGVALERITPAAVENATLQEMVSELARGAAAPAETGVSAEVAASAETAAVAPPVAGAVAPEVVVVPSEPAQLEALIEEMLRETAADATPAPELEALDALVGDLGRKTAPAEPVDAHEPAPVEAAADPPVEAPTMVEAPAAAEAHALEAAVTREPALETVEPPAPVEPHEAPPAPVEAPAAVEPEPAPQLVDAPRVAASPAPFEAAPVPAVPAAAVAGETVVLESDPEIRERLRFLIWMRKLRDKNRGEVEHVR
jgi:hypothetical protein